MDENIANKSITILIAEDEESNFLLLKTILKRHCNILHAKTGKELLEIYKEQHADLILMDIKMPEMNGIDALKEIRKFDTEIPVIMQSAYAFENEYGIGTSGRKQRIHHETVNIKELKATLSSFLPELTW